MFTPFYQHWFKDFDLTPLAETKINCASCTMVNPPQNETLRDPGPFDAKLKCCTYSPFIPNFSLGRILSVGRVEPFSNVNAFVSPLGFIPSAVGNRVDQRCGFLSDEQAFCTIWDSRPAVCASYHCLSSQGRRGLEYWSKVEALGNLMEWTLAHETLWALGFTSEETSEMSRAVESGEAHAVKKSWYEWQGREKELYVRSCELALEISGRELRESLGEEGETLIGEIRSLKSAESLILESRCGRDGSHQTRKNFHFESSYGTPKKTR